MSYDKKVNEITKLCVEFCEESIGRDVGTLYLRGSYPRGDWVFGLSDLDFYVILKDRVVCEPSYQALKHFVDELRLAHPAYRISLQCNTTRRILNDKCKGYITKRDSRHLFGEDLLPTVAEPDIDELKKYGNKVAIYLCDYWLDSIKSCGSQSSKYFTADVRLAQYLTLKIAQNALFGEGKLKFKKPAIVEEFHNTFQNFELHGLVKDAYAIRSKWSTVRRDVQLLETFLERNIRFPLSFKKYLTGSIGSNVMDSRKAR